MVNREPCGEGRRGREEAKLFSIFSRHLSTGNEKNREESETGERARVSDERGEANLTFFKERERERVIGEHVRDTRNTRSRITVIE